MGVIQSVLDKVQAMRKHHADVNAFRQSLMLAVQDGHLSGIEALKLREEFRAYGLTLEDVKGFRAQAYTKALEVESKDGKLTRQDEEELKKIQELLKIPDSEIVGSKRTLLRLRLLTEIQDGHLPVQSAPGLGLQKNEVAHWSEPAGLIEERVVSKGYVGGSQGFSFRVMKGVTYRVGVSKGHLVTDTAQLKVSRGPFVVTSQRAVFQGNSKAFAFRLDKLLDVHMFADGVRLTGPNGVPHTLEFDSTYNVDIIGAILSRAMNILAT
jgi:hypothetical protein